MASPKTTITATCACKTFTLSISFPTTDLPYNRSICLCTTCRQLSGSCGNTYIQLPTNTPTIDPSSFSLTTYNSSSELIRYFCSTCSAHVLIYKHEAKTWHLATGIWDRTEGIINWTGTKWVQDTLDGGVSVWFRDIEDARGKRNLDRWMLSDSGDDAELVPPDALLTLPPKSTEQAKEHPDEEKLQAKCHCGGVQFYITRPNALSARLNAPYPDLITPYHSLNTSSNPSHEHEPWFLRSSGTKYLAGTCTCPTCRQSLGFEIQTWAFIPLANIFHSTGEPVTDFRSMGTLKRYVSSEGVYRDSCGKCGASVFWSSEGREGLVDVSVGVLDPGEGARCEDWLEWWCGRVSFGEEAVSGCLVESLGRGLGEWGRERERENKERVG